MNEEELILEIAEITLALSHIRKAGQSYTIDSGGSKRTVTLADYDSLLKDRQSLQSQLAEVQGLGGLVIGPWW